MSRATLLIFALLALACTFAVAETLENSWETFGSSGNAPSDDSWDFFVLAQQWPGGFPDGTWPACASTFTLHGLWPTRNDSTWPSDCSTIPFNAGKLGNLISTMNCQWPSSNGDQTQFWSHEWTTHGTCAANDPITATEYEFFSTALLAHSNADVYHALSAANILPSESQDYSAASIRSAVNSALGVVPILGCDDHRLTTLQICVDKSLTFIACPESMMSGDSCGTGTLWYNTIKHSSK